MDPNESAEIRSSPKSQLGQREAYEKLAKQQHQEFKACNVSFYSLLTSFAVHIASETEKKKLKPPQQIQIDDNGT
jgi:hypothetical protein